MVVEGAGTGTPIFGKTLDQLDSGLLQVTIFLKNRRSGPLKKISIEDLVPPDHAMSAIPDENRISRRWHDEEGFHMEWSYREIPPGGEIRLEYTLEPEGDTTTKCATCGSLKFVQVAECFACDLRRAEELDRKQMDARQEGDRDEKQEKWSQWEQEWRDWRATASKEEKRGRAYFKLQDWVRDFRLEEE